MKKLDNNAKRCEVEEREDRNLITVINIDIKRAKKKVSRLVFS